MKSRLLYPAITAAALHLGFLFAFNDEAGAVESTIDPTGPMQLDRVPPTFVVDLAPLEVAELDEAASDESESPSVDVPDGPAPVIEAGPIIEMGPISADTEIVGIVVEGSWTKPKLRGPGNGEPGGYGSPTLDISSLDNQPRATFQTSPHYPINLRREGVAGQVTVTFVVGRDGRVVDARVLEATHSDFAREAEQAVRKWRFEPGQRHGAPVQFRMTVPIVFSVN